VNCSYQQQQQQHHQTQAPQRRRSYPASRSCPTTTQTHPKGTNYRPTPLKVTVHETRLHVHHKNSRLWSSGTEEKGSETSFFSFSKTAPFLPSCPLSCVFLPAGLAKLTPSLASSGSANSDGISDGVDLLARMLVNKLLFFVHGASFKMGVEKGRASLCQSLFCARSVPLESTSLSKRSDLV